MSTEHNDYQRKRRRAKGIGPHAAFDAALDLDSAMSAGGYSSATALGQEVGLSGSSLKVARERGLTIWTADRIATALKLHPYDIWGDRWFEAGERHESLDDLEQTG